MTLEYTNRRGDRYYVLQGRTKTGKPKFYCSRKPGGMDVDRLPEDFEIYEHPQTALVSVRKIKPSRLTEIEAGFLRDQIRSRAGIERFIVDRSGDAFVIYVCDNNPGDFAKMMSRLLGPLGAGAEMSREWTIRHTSYSPAFRLTLKNASKRLFGIERWCFLGAIDGWIRLLSPELPLDELTAKYFRHLGKDTFFDLM